MNTSPHVVIVTDAWYPHLSGVLRTVESLCAELERRSVSFTVLHPKSFPSVQFPLYPDIKLAFPTAFHTKVSEILDTNEDVRIHIMTEGPLGLSMRNYCLAKSMAFTTSFHTHWHKYAKTYLRVPERITMRYVREFHAPATRVLVSSEEAKQELVQAGFENTIAICRCGVDTNMFAPPHAKKENVPPRLLYVGRVGKEKNIEVFLELDVEGVKVVVGDGPDRERLASKYPSALFLGALEGEELVRAYQSADVFVFPSLTDTFGMVLLEALACGVPIATHPSIGARLLITAPEIGAYSENLAEAVRNAYTHGSVRECVARVQEFSWFAITETFLNQLVPTGKPGKMSSTVMAHLVRPPQELRKIFQDFGYARKISGIDRVLSFFKRSI